MGLALNINACAPTAVQRVENSEVQLSTHMCHVTAGPQ